MRTAESDSSVIDAAASRTPVVSLQGVRKTYAPRSGVFAVDGVDIDVFAGEIVALLGASGCGKTTTLRLIAGLERCTEGRIRFDGELVDDPSSNLFVPANRRNIGMVFQSYAIWPHMTVYDNVAYGARIRFNGRSGRARVDAAVLKALAMVGMEDLAQRRATNLSGGQQQRVAVARALAYEPRVLLLDEPFSNLDAKRREAMRSELKLLQREIGVPTVFVTHDQVEALSLADRVAVMEAGRIEQIAPPTALYRSPTTAHVRDFIGSTFTVRGTVVSQAGGSGEIEVSDRFRIRGRVARGQEVRVGGVADATVRPEDLTGRRADGVAAGPNWLTAEMRAVLFLGEQYEIRILLPWGQESLIRMPVTDDWTEGEALDLYLPEEKVRLWPAH